MVGDRREDSSYTKGFRVCGGSEPGRGKRGGLAPPHRGPAATTYQINVVPNGRGVISVGMPASAPPRHHRIAHQNLSAYGPAAAATTFLRRRGIPDPSARLSGEYYRKRFRPNYYHRYYYNREEMPQPCATVTIIETLAL